MGITIKCTFNKYLISSCHLIFHWSGLLCQSQGLAAILRVVQLVKQAQALWSMGSQGSIALKRACEVGVAIAGNGIHEAQAPDTRRLCSGERMMPNGGDHCKVFARQGLELCECHPQRAPGHPDFAGSFQHNKALLYLLPMT